MPSPDIAAKSRFCRALINSVKWETPSGYAMISHVVTHTVRPIAGLLARLMAATGASRAIADAILAERSVFG